MSSLSAVLLRLSLLLGFFALLVSCSRMPETQQTQGTVKVRIPWPDSKGQYQLQDISLSGLDNLEQVRGRYAEFVVAPQLEGRQISGARAKARFIPNAKGTFIPADETSQHMAIMYAHLERLFDLEKQAGLKSALSWPRTIGLGVRLHDGSDLLVDNSFYEGLSDAILVVPYKQGALPLAANGGVLAHEHFHAIFFKAVLEPLIAADLWDAEVSGTVHNERRIREILGWSRGTRDEEDSVNEVERHRQLLLRALNEGLADVWAWIYTQDPEFLAWSLPTVREIRSLDLPRDGFGRSFLSGEEIREQLRLRRQPLRGAGDQFGRFAYIVGTQFSRAVKENLQIQAPRDPQRQAQLISAFLPRFADLFLSTPRDEVPEIQSLFLQLLEMSGPLPAEACESARRWLRDQVGPGKTRRAWQCAPAEKGFQLKLESEAT